VPPGGGRSWLPASRLDQPPGGGRAGPGRPGGRPGWPGGAVKVPAGRPGAGIQPRPGPAGLPRIPGNVGSSR